MPTVCARRADSRRGANRGEHRRSGGAVDTSRRAYRVHAGWSCDQSRGPDADRGAVGGIAISEDTRRLVEGYFELRGLGAHRDKGSS